MPFKPDSTTTTIPQGDIFRPSRFIPETSPLEKIESLSNPSLGKRIESDIQKRGEEVYGAITDKTKSPVTRGFKATASAFGGIGDILTETIKSVPVVKDLYGAIEKRIQGGAKTVIDRLSETALFREAAQNPEGTKKIEEVLSVLGSGGEIAGNILAAEGAKTTIQSVTDTSSRLLNRLSSQSEASVRDTLVKRFEQGIKPILSGKKTSAQLEGYRDDVVEAVKTIKSNKQNLSFADDASDDLIEPITGQTPKTLNQLGEAIEQTKKKLFTDYDSMAKTAGEAGAKVSPKGIVNELDTVVSNRALQLSNPDAIAYAQKWQERLKNIDDLTTVDAQEVVQNLNKSLEAFYRNPSYDAASRAAVDALVANKLRSSLDEAITALEGEGYRSLRQQYGALKTIERDVLRATLRQSRTNVKGLIDYTDIFSGGQLVSGLLTLNPQLIATGLTQKAIASYFKFLNSPNRAIENVFKLADKLPD